MKKKEGRHIDIRMVRSLRSVLGIVWSPAVLLILLVAPTCISCGSGGSDLEARVKLLEAAQAQTSTRLQKVTGELDSLTKGQLIGVLDMIERADLHHMDTVLKTATRIDPLYLVAVRKLSRAVIATPWPTPLKEKAEVFKAALTEFDTTLTSNDLKASREAVRQAHLAYHRLTDAGWKLIAIESSA